MLSELAHFNNARRYSPILLGLAVVFAAIGLALIGTTTVQENVPWLADIVIPNAASYLGAAFMVVSGGFFPAGLLALVRQRLLANELRESASAEKTQSKSAFKLKSRWRRLALPKVMRPKIEWLGGGFQVAVGMTFAIAAMKSIVASWTVSAVSAVNPVSQQILAGILVVAAFPLLVLERIYANTPKETLPEAPQLNRLLRVPLTVSIGSAVAMILLSVGLKWPMQLERALAVLVFAVALEIIVRGIATIFVPTASIQTRRSSADSALAGLLQFRLPSFSSINKTMERQFGIDLTRSWALAFVRRLALPVVTGMAVFAWCLTGVTALRLDERAVYERFGSPVEVFGPGLHFHLPWPLGITRSVELGVVHEIPIVFASENEDLFLLKPSTVGSDQSTNMVGAEDPAPPNADRLWDTSHPSEASYLIASESDGRQSFQIVNVDLRVVYRVGLTDAAARQFSYNVADPEALIRAVTGELLVRYFARYTLLDVLGQNRESITNQFKVALQQELDRLSSGIEAIAVVVEAIHPPPGAASAYHNVQAAEINANSQISLEKGLAIRTMTTAEQQATSARNDALGLASELVNNARGSTLRFESDRTAYQRDGRAFLFERWLERLSSSLGNTELLVVDHRLNGQNAPTIDLRSFNFPDSGSGSNTSGLPLGQTNDRSYGDEGE